MQADPARATEGIEGLRATIDSVFVYLGTRQRSFAKAFEQFGPVVARI
jgi:hypothetical protein